MTTLSSVFVQKLRSGITFAAALALIISPFAAGFSVAHAAGTGGAPTADPQSVSTNQDTPLAITLTATDPEGDTPLTYAVVTQPTQGSLSGTAPSLTYTPNAGYSGPDSFTFTASDGATDSSPATIDITVVASTNIAVPGDYSTIQDAIDNANDGDTITVAAGTYEGFTINGMSDLTITGAGDSTMIVPSTLIDTNTGHKYTASHATASVFVNDSTNITLQGMDIESGSNTPDAIVFWNASTGTIDNATVKGTYTITGAQTGQGIAVDASTGDTTDLTVQDTDISGFQKNGIDIVDGNGTGANGGTITVSVKNGSITGAGSIGTIAQNGILTWNQGGGDVSATVNGTEISNLQYSGSGAADTGVLVYGTSTVSSISNVDFNNVDLYIDTEPGSGAINATSGNSFDGVSISGATGVQLAAIEDKIGDVMSDNTLQPVYLLPHTLIVTQNNLGIQAGIDAAGSGDTVRVTPGTYTGPITFTHNNITLTGESGVTVNESASDIFGYGVTVDNASGVSINDIAFTVPVGAPIGYAFHAYKADDLSLSGLSFTGPGKTSTHIGGVDVNTSNNVSITDVSASNFYKNGFAFTTQYASADAAADGIILRNISAMNNGWAGVAFYTVGNDHSTNPSPSIGGSASFSDVHFLGASTISGNAKGVQVQGDSDANTAGSSTPANTVTTDGTTLDLSRVDFSGNTSFDVVNYQTAPVNAVGATFEGKIGFDMTGPERSAEDAKLFDKNDNALLGLVTYIEIVVNHGGGSSGSGGGSTNTGTTGTVTTTTTTTSGQVLGAATFNFTTDLTVGSRGSDVTELQTILIAGGYLHIDAPTGYFGPLTQAAVKLYQASHGIITTGYVGPLTRAALNAGTPAMGMSDADKAALQVKIAAMLAQVAALQAQLSASK